MTVGWMPAMLIVSCRVWYTESVSIACSPDWELTLQVCVCLPLIDNAMTIDIAHN